MTKGKKNLPHWSYKCSCCGGEVSERLARMQYEEAHLTEGSMCEDCLVDMDFPSWVKNGIERVAEELSEENEKKYRQMDEGRQVYILRKLIEKGAVGFGEIK